MPWSIPLMYLIFARRTARTALSPGEPQPPAARWSRWWWWSCSAARDAYAAESFALMIVSRLFSVFCCLFLLYLRSDILEGALEQERLELLRLGAIQREQYEQRKENIELINVKCHDLKLPHRAVGAPDGQVPRRSCGR